MTACVGAPHAVFTFIQLPPSLFLLGNASSAWTSPLRIRRKCSNPLLSAVYSLMCLQPSTSALAMREVSWDVLPCHIPASWISSGRCAFSHMPVLQRGLHTLPAGPVAVQQNVGSAVSNQGIVFGFFLSFTFCRLSGKAALGAKEAAAMENVHGHAKYCEANH